MRTLSLGQKVSAACATFALGATMIAGPAFAATSDPNGPSFGDIDTKKDGHSSITLYKHETQKGATQYGDPSQTADSLAAASAPVKDVVFAAFKATGLTLTGDSAKASWDKLAAIGETIPANACDAVSYDGSNVTGTPTVGELTFEAGVALAATDATGMAKLANQNFGAYVFCEVKAPDYVTDKAAPFLVTLPYPDVRRDASQTATGKWVYDVSVYPKNTTKNTVNKTIKEQEKFGLGEVVRFPVSARVPALAQDGYFKTIFFEDPMDTRFGRESLGVESVTVGGETLQKDVDYKVGIEAEGNADGDGRNSIYVELTYAGREKVKAHHGEQIEVIFTGKVTQLGDGTIANKAKVWIIPGTPEEPNTPPEEPEEPPTTPPDEPPSKTPEVKDYWGDAKIFKRDAGDQKTGLSGATFQVYNAADPYAADCSTATKTGDPIEVLVDGQMSSEFVSGEDGVVTIPVCSLATRKTLRRIRRNAAMSSSKPRRLRATSFRRTWTRRSLSRLERPKWPPLTMR